MKKYIQVFKIKLRDTMEYRFDMVFGYFSHFLPLAAILILWKAVYAGKTVIAGYTYAMILSYFLLARACQAMLWLGLYNDVEKEIKDGQLSKYLLRPINYWGYWLSRSLADKAINLVVVGAFFGVLAFFLKGWFVFQKDPVFLVLFALTFFLGFLINFFLTFAVSLSAFWLQEIWSVGFTKDMVHEFFSGGVFPLELLPAGLHAAAMWLPFAYCLNFPLRVYLGLMTVPEILQGLGMQLFFVGVCFLLFQWTWDRGLRRYEAVGA
jgi:ABC-2 type transport system permease protein